MKEIREALGLYRSMVRSGEKETPTSSEAFDKAMAALDELGTADLAHVRAALRGHLDDCSAKKPFFGTASEDSGCDCGFQAATDAGIGKEVLDAILPASALREELSTAVDDLNGKLTQVSNWLAGSVPEHHRMRDELAEIINRHSAENGSDTPDFILAEYLTGCLAMYDRALAAREHWYERKLTKEKL